MRRRVSFLLLGVLLCSLSVTRGDEVESEDSELEELEANLQDLITEEKDEERNNDEGAITDDREQLHDILEDKAREEVLLARSRSRSGFADMVEAEAVSEELDERNEGKRPENRILHVDPHNGSPQRRRRRRRRRRRG